MRVGLLARFILLPGQRHDSTGAPPLLAGIGCAALFADKAFDNDWLRVELDERGVVAVIPPKTNRARRIPCDFALDRWRHLIENFFCQLRAFRRIATRDDTTDTSFAAMLHLAGAALALK